MYRAQEFYESVRNSRAFNNPMDAKVLSANQYGIRFVFPDGSYLIINTYANLIEWRSEAPVKKPPGYGAVRKLWSY